jgi:hypothetical protein
MPSLEYFLLPGASRGAACLDQGHALAAPAGFFRRKSLPDWALLNTAPVFYGSGASIWSGSFFSAPQAFRQQHARQLPVPAVTLTASRRPSQRSCGLSKVPQYGALFQAVRAVLGRKGFGRRCGWVKTSSGRRRAGHEALTPFRAIFCLPQNHAGGAPPAFAPTSCLRETPCVPSPRAPAHEGPPGAAVTARTA